MNKKMQQVPKAYLKSLIKTKSRQEISEKLGVPLRTLSRYIKKWDLNNLSKIRFPSELTKKQIQIINGTLLGDSHLKKISGRAKNSRFSFKQKMQNKEYVDYIHNAMKPFSQKVICGKSKHHLTNKFYPYASMQTCCHPVFTELRNKWYSDNIKVVPKDIELNDTVLSHWVMCDGCNCKSTKSYILCTDSFTRKENQFLASQLYKKYNIKSNVTSSNRIFIGAREYFDFIEILKPLITLDCMKYKVDTSKIKSTRKGWGSNKLNMAKAKKIRDLYFNSNYTQQNLADMFNVCRTAINKVINNISYKEPTMAAFKGDATIKVSFNYGNKK